MITKTDWRSRLYCGLMAVWFVMQLPVMRAFSAEAAVGATQQQDTELGNSRSTSIIDQAGQVFAQRCLNCHSGLEPAGEVDLLRPDRVVRGDDGQTMPRDSALWEVIRDERMPPEEPLSREEQAVIRNWIQAGAPWDGRSLDPFANSNESRAGRDWWSLQPLANPEPPKTDDPRQRTAVDGFVIHKLTEQGLTLAPDAAPRDLIRRLFFDLIGLPPSPEIVSAFVKDPSEQHYEQWVDRLLAQPEYGERWARHWLDLVRFGESDGFERNAPRPDAWPYRDWVIDAFNRDLPFDQFVQQQIAGDLLLADEIQARAATGYLVAGVHNTVVGVSPTMQLIARQDELEDLIGSVGQTFLGLTLHCARCHDHKFDPITQREYYELAACVAGVNHGLTTVRPVELNRRLADLEQKVSAQKQILQSLEAPVRQHWLEQKRGNPNGVSAISDGDLAIDFQNRPDGLVSMTGWEWFGDVQLAADGLQLNGTNAYGRSPALPWDLAEKTLEVWLKIPDLDQAGGGVISVESLDGQRFDAIVFAEREPRQWMAGSEFYQRTKSWQGPSEEVGPDQWIHLAVTFAADGTVTAFRNGQRYGTSVMATPPLSFAAGQSRLLVGLRHSPPGGNKFWRGTVGQLQIHRRVLGADEIQQRAELSGLTMGDQVWRESLTPEQWQMRQQTIQKIESLSAERAELQRQPLIQVYSQVSQTPHTVNVLARGDVTRPGDLAGPNVLNVLQTQVPWDELPPDASDAQRRLQLAKWITHPNQALFHRVIVNRLWQQHFGAGLVPTASDFGFNGGRPSHPQLLDWLANQLKANQYRLKPLHKLIVMSTAYRQSSLGNALGKQRDADNRWLWRRTPMRLDAETIRDAMLVVAGQLNAERGGPGYLDVKIVDEGNGTTYYEPIDRDEPAFNRRTIYRFTPRGGRSALLDNFDCPDPAAATPLRTVTTTPLQALSLLNNEFVLRLSEHFADRAQQTTDSPVQVVEYMFLAALARLPAEDEAEAAVELVKQHGAVALARALFNSAEFVVAR